MGTVDRRCGAAGHLLGSGRHLVHCRGDLLDLSALAADGLVTTGRHRVNLLSLTLDLDHCVADLLNQIVNTLDGAIEHCTQLSEFITATGVKVHRHISGSDFVHDRAQGFQGVPGGRIEAAVEIDNQQKHPGQGRHQHNHVQTMFTQALLQLLIEKLAGCRVQGVGLRHQLADLLIKTRPRCIKGFGHHHLLFEQFIGLFQ
ncbi:hypothetical protein D3C79_770150 [compost metagenome]